MTAVKIVVITFFHVCCQHGFVSEYEGVEDSLTCSVEGSVQTNVTVSLFATAVLTVDVAVDPMEEQVQTGPHSAEGGNKEK